MERVRAKIPSRLHLSTSSVSLGANETEDVTISLNIDNEEEADKYCWEVTGTVSSDPTGNSSDTQEFDITVPILKGMRAYSFEINNEH
jgi:uncharacterized membrane protein